MVEVVLAVRDDNHGVGGDGGVMWCVAWWCDGDDVKVAVAAVKWGRRGVAARGGEWCGGSYRSREGEYSWGSPEMFFGVGGGSRMWAAVAGVVAGNVTTIGQNSTNNTNTFSAAGPSNSDVNPTLREYSYVDHSQYPNDPTMPALEDITYSDDKEDVGVEADFSNLETTITISPILTTRVHKDHPVTQIIGDLSTATQIRYMTRMVKDQVDLPNGKKAMGTKWVFRNKKDERGIVFRNKARLAAQGHIKEEGIDYEEVFAAVARIKAIRLFLAYASFMGFMVYQMDVKSAFLYETIEEEVYVYQPPGFEDPDYPDKVQFRRTSLTGFPAQSIRSSNTIALDSPYLLVLLPERLKADNMNLASHLPQICLMLTLEGFPFITVNSKEYHSECSGNYHKDNA
nr:putative ribonuclease H-like domain-containing protein [Tanacetum cinerariifolium]